VEIPVVVFEPVGDWWVGHRYFLLVENQSQQ
jgi:hypothetical protein